MPVLPELESLLERIRAAEGRFDSLPLAERRAIVHQGIDAQLEHMVEPVPAAPYSDHLVAVDGGADHGPPLPSGERHHARAAISTSTAAAGGWAPSIRATSPAAAS